jgi:hypothetical protein
LLVVGVGVGVLNVPANACLQAYSMTSIDTTHSSATIHRIIFAAVWKLSSHLADACR